MTEYCKKTVHTDVFRSNQCSRKAKKDGYCWQHHPDAEKERSKNRNEKWDLENEISNLKFSLRSVGHECVDLAEKLAGKNKEAAKLVERMNEIRKKIVKLRLKLEKHYK